MESYDFKFIEDVVLNHLPDWDLMDMQIEDVSIDHIIAATDSILRNITSIDDMKKKAVVGCAGITVVGLMARQLKRENDDGKVEKSSL